MNKKDERSGSLETNCGAEVVNGLNMLAAIVTHPDTKKIRKKVIKRIQERTGVERSDLYRNLIAALDFLTEINKTVQSCGIEPIKKDKN